MGPLSVGVALSPTTEEIRLSALGQPDGLATIGVCPVATEVPLLTSRSLRRTAHLSPHRWRWECSLFFSSRPPSLRSFADGVAPRRFLPGPPRLGAWLSRLRRAILSAARWTLCCARFALTPDTKRWSSSF